MTARGIDRHAICLFPAVDMPDGHTGGWLRNGICDLEDDSGRLRRVPFTSYADELRRWQRLLHRVTEPDDDPFSDPRELEDGVHAAQRFDVQADRNLH